MKTLLFFSQLFLLQDWKKGTYKLCLEKKIQNEMCILLRISSACAAILMRLFIGTLRIAKDQTLLHVDKEKSDQIAWMHWLIRVPCTHLYVGFGCALAHLVFTNLSLQKACMQEITDLKTITHLVWKWTTKILNSKCFMLLVPICSCTIAFCTCNVVSNWNPPVKVKIHTQW